MNKILTFAFDIKDADSETGLIEGYASTFENIDLGGDKVKKGAFRKTLRENKGKFPILDSHDPSKQIGWNIEAKEDDFGLFVKGELDVKNNQAAREKHSLISKALEIKAKAGLSIGYMPVKFDFDEDDNGMRFRNLKEVKLFEYSPVAFPMNEAAQATAAKQFHEWMKTMNGDESELVEIFLAKLKDDGFNELKIKSALLEAAAKIDDPAHDLGQLFDDGIQTLKS